jgi:hypothetical protein
MFRLWAMALGLCTCKISFLSIRKKQTNICLSIYIYKLATNFTCAKCFTFCQKKNCATRACEVQLIMTHIDRDMQNAHGIDSLGSIA